MFNFFKKARQYDLAWLGVDMHSHLLFGIDDGCVDAKNSLECISGLQELGYRTFHTTPHIFAEMYPNNHETIAAASEQLHQEMEDDGRFGSTSIHAAAEYMIDDEFSTHYMKGPLLTLPGNHILVEMSFQFERKDFYEHLFQLQLRELKPILAHPERYSFYHNRPQELVRIKERGCKLQLNLLSLSGYYGDRTRKMAQHLVREGMIDFIGTDLHHIKHLNAIRQFATTNDLQKVFKNNPLKNRELEK